MSFQLKLNVEITPEPQSEASITPNEIRAAIRAVADILINDRHMVDQIYSSQSGNTTAKVQVVATNWQPATPVSKSISFSFETRVDTEV